MFVAYFYKVRYYCNSVYLYILLLGCFAGATTPVLSPLRRYGPSPY